MNNKKLITIILIGITVLVVATLILLKPQIEELSYDGTDNANPVQIEEKDRAFSVVRVLPSGFSPSEVNIKKGMIVRFTNPLEERVDIVWEGDTQYTNEAVFEGNDIATTVFDTEGEYTFRSESIVGKVVVK